MRVDACLSRALLNELLLIKNFHIIKKSLEFDGSIFYYVKISDFEALGHSEGQGCTRDKKLESEQYAGERLSK